MEPTRVAAPAGKLPGNVRAALWSSLGHAAIFSAVANVLLLVLPIYMLQIYDRVLPASNFETLAYISLIALVALIVLGVLETVRAIYASRVSMRLDREIGNDVFLAAIGAPGAVTGEIQPLRDLAAIRAFVSSRALFFLFDLPFLPLFMVALWFIHPMLVLVTALGAVIMAGIALVNQLVTMRQAREASDLNNASMVSAQVFGRAYETVRALGMIRTATEAWGRQFSGSVRTAQHVAAKNAFWGGVSRTMRLVLQMATLGVGAYLVLEGQMTAGMIFAASMLSSRALQPMDQIIGGWRQIVDASSAWRRVMRARASVAAPAEAIALPTPRGEVTLSNLVYFPPGSALTGQPLIKGVSVKISAGDSVAIVGPSRAGKSTLARLIVGAIPPRSGNVRLDGSDIRHMDPDVLGRHVGYLAQEVELFPGTVAQNIARLDPGARDEDIVKAAQRAHAHLQILSFQESYATQIGPGGVRLSGGERQRVGLARAFYGNPRLLVLDEPNANLDGEGEQALEAAIQQAHAEGVTVLVITHRPSLALKCEKVMVFTDGRIEAFGPAQETMARLAQGNRPEQGFRSGPVPVRVS